MTQLSHKDSFEKLLGNLAIVLMHPKYPENIGAAARVAVNMGISKLLVIRNELPDRDKMLQVATHEAAHLIDTMEIHNGLDHALAPFSLVVGTTARLGRKRGVEHTPRDIVSKILPLLANNQVALLFGPEHRGLTNDDLKFCQLTVTIPTADFSSLNLAQAVAVLCYEIYYGVWTSSGGIKQIPRLASSRELEGMYQHVEHLLATIGFLKTEDTTYWLRNIRLLLGRIGLRPKEARIIRGFCRQFLWHEKKEMKEDTFPGED